MNPTEQPGDPAAQPLKAGDEFGSYKVVEWSRDRILLRPDYVMGLFLLVLGCVVLALDVLMLTGGDLSGRHTVDPGIRLFLYSLPPAVKGGMFVLPILGFGWFFVMTGRSMLVDFNRKVARKGRFFFFGETVDLADVGALRLQITPTSIRGDFVGLHLVDARKQSRMELANETASEDEFDSTPTTDFAKMLALVQYMGGVMHVPVTRQGEPVKMSEINRKLMAAVGALPEGP